MRSAVRYLCIILARFTEIITTAILLALLIGCASNQLPVQQFYTIKPFASDEQLLQGSVGINNAELVIGQVTAPAYLAQAGIVIAGTEGNLELANYHLWVEPPAVAIKRYLERCALSYGKSIRKRQRIDIEIHRFQGDGSGGVIFDGVWNKYTVSDGAALGTFLFDYREPQRGDGFGALATALSRTVELLCVDILDKTL